MAGEMESSRVFPNLKIESSIKITIDNVLQKLKDSPDSDVQEFVSKLKLKNYEIKDGSPSDQQLCVGSNNSNTQTMFIPTKLVGTYTGLNNKQHAVTVERMLAHELAHALGYDRIDSVMTSNVMPRLHELAMQDGQAIRHAGARLTPAQLAGSHSKFPASVAHEAGAVAVENFIARQAFHDFNTRLNVNDKNPNFSVEDLRSWGSDGYPIKGNCRGMPLSRDAELSVLDKFDPALAKYAALDSSAKVASEHVAAKNVLLEKISDMSEHAQNIVIAQLNLNAAKNSEIEFKTEFSRGA